MLKIKFDAHGADIRLKRIRKAVRDFSPFFRSVLRPLVLEKLEKIFATEDDGSWARLSPRYARLKRNRYGSLPILQATGALKRSYLQVGAANNISIIRKRSFRHGTDLEYARFHERRSRGVPIRAVVKLLNKDAALSALIHSRLYTWMRAKYGD